MYQFCEQIRYVDRFWLLHPNLVSVAWRHFWPYPFLCMAVRNALVNFSSINFLKVSILLWMIVMLLRTIVLTWKKIICQNTVRNHLSKHCKNHLSKQCKNSFWRSVFPNHSSAEQSVSQQLIYDGTKIRAGTFSLAHYHVSLFSLAAVIWKFTWISLIWLFNFNY